MTVLYDQCGGEWIYCVEWYSRSSRLWMDHVCLCLIIWAKVIRQTDRIALDLLVMSLNRLWLSPNYLNVYRWYTERHTTALLASALLFVIMINSRRVCSIASTKVNYALFRYNTIFTVAAGVSIVKVDIIGMYYFSTYRHSIYYASSLNKYYESCLISAKNMNYFI